MIRPAETVQLAGSTPEADMGAESQRLIDRHSQGK